MKRSPVYLFFLQALVLSQRGRRTTRNGSHLGIQSGGCLCSSFWAMSLSNRSSPHRISCHGMFLTAKWSLMHFFWGGEALRARARKLTENILHGLNSVALQRSLSRNIKCFQCRFCFGRFLGNRRVLRWLWELARYFGRTRVAARSHDDDRRADALSFGCRTRASALMAPGSDMLIL